MWWSLGDEATWPAALPRDCGNPAVLERTTNRAWLSNGDAAWKLSSESDSVRDPCTEATNQLVLNTCAAEEQDEAELETVYRELLKRLRPEQKARLEAAQHDWLIFRETECSFEAAEFFEGGQAEPMVRAGCLREAARTRTVQLQELLETLSGN